jgi:Tfp pilus assembly protein PilO
MNDLPKAVQIVLFILTMSLVIGLGWYVGALSKGNRGNHIPEAWRH